MKRVLALMLSLSLAGFVGTATIAQTARIQTQVEVALLAERVVPTPSTHNRITPQEIAEGWISLFDGETTFGWTAPNGSKWTIVDGMLAPQIGKHGLLATTTAFADYDLSIQYRVRRDSKAAVFVFCDRDARGAENIQSGRPKSVTKDGKEQPTEMGPRELDLPSYSESWMEAVIAVRGADANVVSINQAGNRNGFRTVSAQVKGGPVEKPKTQGGYIALSGNAVIFRDVKLKPVNTKPLFNGKDLTGWKKFEGDAKRAKSIFAVSPEGWLTIKNGPGDLQTEGQWDDFVLQIECKTNGKFLNSGVFFRCRPGEYQNGYEAQIHNGWLDTPLKEYVVEDYDPKTHELKDKRKVQSAALDYGTGSIYRRVPARKAVAKDNEWFTMTVVAEGNHFATWVDGVQVVDWDDNRPLKDNARNGCKLEKGPISLQGHDPTTDLAFRHIRLAELTTTKREK